MFARLLIRRCWLFREAPWAACVSLRWHAGGRWARGCTRRIGLPGFERPPERLRHASVLPQNSLRQQQPAQIIFVEVTLKYLVEQCSQIGNPVLFANHRLSQVQPAMPDQVCPGSDWRMLGRVGHSLLQPVQRIGWRATFCFVIVHIYTAIATERSLSLH